MLRKLPKSQFCVALGKSLRGEVVPEIDGVKDAIGLVRTEALHRKLSFNSSLIRSGKIKIGMTECELLASWGYPHDKHENVGRWGVHIQHVFGNFGPYVYTENGRVTSWQN